MEQAQSVLISIVMPVKNGSRYIVQTIKSVQAQSWPDWELLVVDGHSTDDTMTLVELLSEKDARIRTVYDVRSCTAAAARSVGIGQAAGQWIAFLDSDDLWEKNKLTLQMQLIAQEQAQFSFTASRFIDKDGKPFGYVFQVPQKVGYPQILKQDVISCSSVLLRKELAEKYVCPCPDEISEDYSAWIHLLREEKITAYGLQQPLLVYRVTAMSRSGNKLLSALRTFRTYRYCKIGLPRTLWYFGSYVCRSLKKYIPLYWSKSKINR